MSSFETELRRDVRAMACEVQLASARDEELRIAVLALSGQDDPAVEPGRVAAEVPLADHPRVITAGLKTLGHIVARVIEAMEHRHAFQVRIRSGEQRRATGRADGMGDEAKESDGKAERGVPHTVKWKRVHVSGRKLIMGRPAVCVR
jgi:hypothetical protein